MNFSQGVQKVTIKTVALIGAGNMGSRMAKKCA